MSRVHVKNNNRARQPAAPRLLKTKDISNDTYQEPTSRRNKGPKYHANGYKRRRKAASPSVSESSGDFDAEDASDEKSDDDDEDDEEDNEPALLAPARSGLSLEPGLPEFDVVEADVELESPYPLPILEDEYPTFNFDGPEPDLSLAIESEDYNEVDNISESDDANSEMYEEQQLLNQLTDEDELEELDLLNQIDGMSAYGFGDDSDAGAYHSSQGSETAAEDAPERHVRFQVDEAAAFRPTILQSPTFSRTLLPAAFGHQRGLLGEPLRPDLYDSSSEDEDYDCRLCDLSFHALLIPPQLTLPKSACRLKLTCKNKIQNSQSLRKSKLRLQMHPRLTLRPSGKGQKVHVGASSSMTEQKLQACSTALVGSC